MLKGKYIYLLIFFLLLIDQIIKVYVKTHFYYGEEHMILGLSWLRMHFLENPGMAWGWKLGEGDAAKIALTVFRLIAVVWGTFYINKLIRKQYTRGFIICVAFIYSGALGNLIDSLFYGLIFERSDPVLQNIASVFPQEGGYAGILFGHVVDMWYLPIFNTKIPNWLPIWGGDYFEFFQPVFNTADVWVSTGVIVLILFQKKFVKREPKVLMNIKSA